MGPACSEISTIDNMRTHWLDADNIGRKFGLDALLQKQTEKTAYAPENTLNCINCGNVITHPGERIEINGQHAHIFSNPHGIRFNIGCFASAPGVVEQDPGTAFWSWFDGYRWQTSLCRQCSVHLGWRFANNDSFYGLILTRLIETKANRHS